MKISEKSVHVAYHSQVMMLVGMGHEPTAQYLATPGDPRSVVFVFSPRARKAADQYLDLRRQVAKTPVIDPPEK